MLAPATAAAVYGVEERERERNDEIRELEI